MKESRPPPKMLDFDRSCKSQQKNLLCHQSRGAGFPPLGTVFEWFAGKLRQASYRSNRPETGQSGMLTRRYRQPPGALWNLRRLSCSDVSSRVRHAPMIRGASPAGATATCMLMCPLAATNVPDLDPTLLVVPSEWTA